MKLDRNELYFQGKGETHKVYITWLIDEESFVSVVSPLFSENFSITTRIEEDGINGYCEINVQSLKDIDIEETIQIEMAEPDSYPKTFELKLMENTAVMAMAEPIVEEPELLSTENSPLPIWKDVIYRATVHSFMRYRIDMLVNGVWENIYFGTAYKIPDKNEIEINVTNIIANFLSSKNNIDGYLTRENYSGKFCIKYIDGRIIRTYVFYNSHTYMTDYVDDGITPSSKPIENIIYKGQHFVGSVWNNGDTSVTEHLLKWKLADGSTQTIGAYTGIGVKPYESWSLSFPTNYPPSNAKGLVLGGKQNYEFVNCPSIKYVLLYKDSMGGYSSIGVNGKVNISSSTVSYSVDRMYDNNKPEFEKKKYAVEEKTIYEVNFVNLSKKKAKRLTEIVNSTEIWIEDIKEFKIVPIVCTTSNLDFQLNRKARNYTITFETSQKRYRR